MIFTFTVPGEPKGKGRPRFTAKGRTYTPEKTRAYENKIKHCYQLQGGGLYEGAVKISVTAYFGIPKSYSKKKRRLIKEGTLLPTKKPDGDNIEKAVLDALNKVAYKDDTQVTDLSIKKRYAFGDERTECLIVTIQEDKMI